MGSGIKPIPLPAYGPTGIETVVDGFNMAYSHDFVHRHELMAMNEVVRIRHIETIHYGLNSGRAIRREWDGLDPAAHRIVAISPNVSM